MSAYDDEHATAAFFSADKTVVSAWVAEMIRHREWRQLIYDLSDQVCSSPIPSPPTHTHELSRTR
jgi:hypothetical protein